MQQAIGELQEKIAKVEKAKDEIERDHCLKVLEYDDLQKNYNKLNDESRSRSLKATRDHETKNSKLES